MLQKFNAYFLAKIGADTAENERNFAEIWQFWQILAPRDDWDQEDQRRVREGAEAFQGRRHVRFGNQNLSGAHYHLQSKGEGATFFTDDHPSKFCKTCIY